MYLVYFDQLFAALESPVAELCEMIEDESRQLLGVVVDRIFTNLRLLTPGFDLSTVTEAAQGEEAHRVSNSLREQVDTFCNPFRRAEATEEDHDESVHGLNSLAKDVEEQVAPAMQRAAEASDSANAARALTKQRERMFEALVTRGNELAVQLGADATHTEVGGRGAAAMYLVYFDQLFVALEGPVAELREMIEDESRQLLGWLLTASLPTSGSSRQASTSPL